MNPQSRLLTCACFCLLISLSALAQAEQARNSPDDSNTEFITWTFRDARLPAFKAKFIRLSGDGKKITLQKEAGGGEIYPIAMLSPASVEQAKKLGEIAALEEKKEGDFTYAIKENTITIIACNGQNGSITFPEKIASLPVTAIEIPYDMLQHPEGVSRVTIPSGVNSISAPLGLCKALSDITVDPANPAYRSVDGVLFDKKGTTLVQYPIGKPDKSYAIPKGVTTVGRSAFWPSPLSSVTIPSTVTHLKWAAFSGTGLTSVTIPSSVTHIEANVFSGCESLVSVTFEGNAPKVEVPNFYKAPANFIIYFYKGSTGFTKPEFMPEYQKTIPVEIDPATKVFDWTSNEGKTIKAKFVKLDNESLVVRQEEGKEHKIPLTRLSPESVALAKKLGGGSK